MHTNPAPRGTVGAPRRGRPRPQPIQALTPPGPGAWHFHFQHLVLSHRLGWAPQELALEALEREVSVQQQIAAAARRLALAPELSAEQRRRRHQVQADALRRLHELEEQLGEVRARLGLSGLPPSQPLPLSTGGAVITTQGVCLGTRLAQLSHGEPGPVIPPTRAGRWALAKGLAGVERMSSQ